MFLDRKGGVAAVLSAAVLFGSAVVGGTPASAAPGHRKEVLSQHECTDIGGGYQGCIDVRLVRKATRTGDEDVKGPVCVSVIDSAGKQVVKECQQVHVRVRSHDGHPPKASQHVTVIFEADGDNKSAGSFRTDKLDEAYRKVGTVPLQPIVGQGGWLIGDGIDAPPGCVGSECNGGNAGLLFGDGGNGSNGGNGGVGGWFFGNGGNGGNGADAVYAGGALVSPATAGGGGGSGGLLFGNGGNGGNGGSDERASSGLTSGDATGANGGVGGHGGTLGIGGAGGHGGNGGNANSVHGNATGGDGGKGGDAAGVGGPGGHGGNANAIDGNAVGGDGGDGGFGAIGGKGGDGGNATAADVTKARGGDGGNGGAAAAGGLPGAPGAHGTP